ncbi:lamin tail domain-containing protein [Patescibacteria group bacterium]|nr:lamin tail domain-containing protein [Patescibacteria group bacterium]
MVRMTKYFISKIHLYHYIILIFIYTTTLTVASYQVTHSYFSDSASSTQNAFTAAAVFPTSTPTPTTTSSNIVINEVNSSASSSAEWVELYNPTSSDINVSGWTILDNYFSDILPTVSPIPSGGYAVIITDNSVVNAIPISAITIKLNGNAIGNGLANDGDSLTLLDTSSTKIDEMSYGNNISVFLIPPSNPNINQTLIRFPNGADTNTANDWISTSSATLGINNN